MEIKGQPAVYTARDDIVEVFADGVHNLSLNNGVLRVELTATRMDEVHPPKPPTARNVPVVRFAVPFQTAVQLHQTLGTLLPMVDKQGALQRGLETPPQAPPAAH